MKNFNPLQVSVPSVVCQIKQQERVYYGYLCVSKKLFFIHLLLFVGLVTHAAKLQDSNGAIDAARQSEKPWKALWIGPSGESGKKYGVYYFRKTIALPSQPGIFRIKVSGDNRFKLYVNGKLASLGPARSDLYSWNYQVVDLAQWLSAGVNVIAAVVWNDGSYRPEAQISHRTGFIVQGDSTQEELLNTNSSWKFYNDAAYTPIIGIGYPAWYIADPGERVDMNKTPKDWMVQGFDDRQWQPSIILDRGNLKGTPDASGWMLVPSPLPPMEMTTQRIMSVRKTEGIRIPAGFPSIKKTIIVPANTTASVLLDQGSLTNAYLNMEFSGGKDAGISLTYAESPFENITGIGTVKGNRNEVEGKIIAGRRDSIISNGLPGQSFSTLYWRTFRYIELKVVTGKDPLLIEDIYGMFTGYPFKRNAKIRSQDKEIKDILDIGWRTARLDAWETYMDCPYYEQLQYIGDTRIQMLVSYFNSGDDRLARNAIAQMDRSRIGEGITLSRYPSSSPQIIPTFSLSYIGVLHDFYKYRPDSGFVREKLVGVRAVLDFFHHYQQSDGSLFGLPYWNFVDWAESGSWPRGVPPIGTKGGSSVLDLQLLIAYQMAAELEAELGMNAYAGIYSDRAAKLSSTIVQKYWVAGKELYADNEDHELFSQHANALAILAGLGTGEENLLLAKNIVNDASLIKGTIYFKYYIHQALIKAGLGSNYLSWLDIWRKAIANGSTTWPEISDLAATRSECHAWGASPNIEFFRTILGIDSDAPGFSRVRIEPHLEGFSKENIGGEIPHPRGKISVDYNGLERCLSISIPEKLSGKLVWKGKSYTMHGGLNRFKVNDHQAEAY